jgi:hypothetical protein
MWKGYQALGWRIATRLFFTRGSIGATLSVFFGFWLTTGLLAAVGLPIAIVLSTLTAIRPEHARGTAVIVSFTVSFLFWQGVRRKMFALRASRIF